jgi:hypothetical protein
MSYGAMSRKVLMSALALLALGSTLATPTARVDAREMGNRSTSVMVAQVQTARYGPYATARRANEIASYFRSRGYNAQVFPEWGSYYVSVW